ncbi:YKT61, partial [Symbiodinium sp. KB8]
HHLHVVAQSNGLFGVVLTSASYSKRVAITMIREQLAAFEKEHGTRWKSATEDNSHPLPSLEEALAKYQKPEEVDKLLRVQRSLDDTKEILVQSIETVLAKGERLEKLVEQSEDLSDQSKMFYKSAAATNSCCLIV